VDRLLTLEQVADLLQVSPRQLKGLRCGPDPLPVKKLNRKIARVRADDLADWLNRRGPDGGGRAASVPSRGGRPRSGIRMLNLNGG
jgi:hypothetical protein